MLVIMKTVFWQDGQVNLVDQTKLPHKEEYLKITDFRELAEAIKTMKVRGAPAIGVTAALGLALAAYHSQAKTTAELIIELEAAAELLGSTRPTAVNLFWAIEHMLEVVAAFNGNDVEKLKKAVVKEAVSLQEADIERNRQLGFNGANLIADGDSILTHCNAGALACAGYGTALGVITAAYEQGKKIHVFVDETRPLLQGARLTAWELTRLGIPMTLITDNMAGYLMKLGRINKVIVGADRIAANGDTANKIGTYSVAVLAQAHNIPFYVAAPTSTIDPKIATGEKIPIEERHPHEVIEVLGQPVAPVNVKVANPAFDVTPANLIAAIITEAGILKPPFPESIKKAVANLK